VPQRAKQKRKRKGKKEEKGRKRKEKGGKRERKSKNSHGGFCLLKPRMAAVPLQLKNSGYATGNRRDDVNTEATFVCLQGTPEKCHDGLLLFF
jgi:hypothetical protein